MKTMSLICQHLKVVLSPGRQLSKGWQKAVREILIVFQDYPDTNIKSTGSVEVI